jgi:type II secretory pathway pseudopilin PulG
MSRGFTLLEVVVALLLMEVAVLAAVGTLALASRTLARAEHLERAVAAAGGVLDSLAGADSLVSAADSFGGARLEWLVDAAGRVVLRATGPDSSIWFEVGSAVEPR